ncbi:MAG: hypothetical protein KC777_17275 [Cyanobacteria bacterium HKST-UBA02]|nr:hypothetical protein [Cyanobacteria bacterium HKST-UBA02]
MNIPIEVRMSRGALIASVYLDEASGTFERKWNIWTQVYPLRHPAIGKIGFNFSREDNHLIGFQLYYAHSCLPVRYSEYSEYFGDNEPIETHAFVDPDFLVYIHFSKEPTGMVRSQSIDFSSPAKGMAVLDIDEENRLSGVELIWCDHRLEG